MAVFQYNHIGVLTIMNQSSKCSTTRRLALQILCTFAAAATVSCKAQNQNTGGLKDYTNWADANQEGARTARDRCREQAFAAKKQQIQACQAPTNYAANSPLAQEIFEGRAARCVEMADRTLGVDLRTCQDEFMAMNQPSNNGSESFAFPFHPGRYNEAPSPEGATIPRGHQRDREDRDEEYLNQKLEEERTARADAEVEEDYDF